MLGDFPVRMEGPNKVSLFAYDNHTFVVESYLSHPATVTVAITDGIARIVNMESGESIAGEAAASRRGWGTTEHGPGTDELFHHNPAA